MRQAERRGLGQAEVDGNFLREDELSPIPAPPHLAARQYSARRDRHERTPDPTHEGQATVTQRLHVCDRRAFGARSRLSPGRLQLRAHVVGEWHSPMLRPSRDDYARLLRTLLADPAARPRAKAIRTQPGSI